LRKISYIYIKEQKDRQDGLGRGLMDASSFK